MHLPTNLFYSMNEVLTNECNILIFGSGWGSLMKNVCQLGQRCQNKMQCLFDEEVTIFVKTLLGLIWFSRFSGSAVSLALRAADGPLSK